MSHLYTERGLPALQGSDKQVAWAWDIRAERIDRLDMLLLRIRRNDPDGAMRILPIINRLKTEPSAAFWIHFRKLGLPALVRKHQKVFNALHGEHNPA